MRLAHILLVTLWLAPLPAANGTTPVGTEGPTARERLRLIDVGGGQVLATSEIVFYERPEVPNENGDGDDTDQILYAYEIATGETRSTGKARPTGSAALASSEHEVFFLVSEFFDGIDFNFDFDFADDVLWYYDAADDVKKTTRLPLTGMWRNATVSVDGSRWAAWISESEEDDDLNQDGDEDDWVLFVGDARGNHLTSKVNTGLTSVPSNQFPSFTFPSVALAGDRVVAAAHEGSAEDLNGDGTLGDTVLHLYDWTSGVASTFPWDVSDFKTEGAGLDWFDLDEQWLVFGLEESQSGVDLNGNGVATDGHVLHVHELATGTTTSLGLSSDEWRMRAGRGVFQVDEALHGVDLNGDTDTSDFIVHLYDFGTGTVTGTGLSGQARAAGQDRYLGVLVFESDHGNLNGDGDTLDMVLHVYDTLLGTAQNLGVAVASSPTYLSWPKGIAIPVSESRQAQDLNGDGDMLDSVAFVHDFATGALRNLEIALFDNLEVRGDVVTFVGLADGLVLVEHDLRTNETSLFPYEVYGFGLGGSRFLAGGRVVLHADEVQTGRDLNGDGDALDPVVLLRDRPTPVADRSPARSTR